MERFQEHPRACGKAVPRMRCQRAEACVNAELRGSRPGTPPANAAFTMLNRSIFAALSLASLSLLPLNALADESEPTPAPAPSREPEPTPVADAEDAPPAYAPAAAPAPYAPAYAAPTEVVRPFPDREGFTIGFGVGVGSLSIQDAKIEPDSTVGISFRLGGAITPNFLLQADLEATRATFKNNAALQLNFFGVSATGYVHPRFYLTGGLGIAGVVEVDSNNKEVGKSDDALGLLLGVGIEAYQSSGFALSIELKGFGATFNDKTVSGGNLLIGFQWF